jgi:lipopolysaccharide transport system ATP-binding protein
MSAIVTLESVSKKFILQHHRARSFQDALVNLFHRRNGSVEEFWALRDVSFEVQQGETLGIIGENGSGKSTILKLITRILDPTEGKIAVNGRVSALIEIGAGFHPDLTGRENIYLNGSILGFSRKEMNRKFDEIVAFSELERFIDMPVKHYSSGMYMRLGFSVAISVDPDILIVDEVLAVGDEIFQRKCLDRISEFRRRGKTIIFVSHGLTVVEQLCDRVVWLDHGVIKDQGPSSRVIRNYMLALQHHDEQNREMAHHVATARLEAAVEVTEAIERAGTQIRGVQLLSEDRKEKYSFRTGETMIVRLGYRVEDPAADHVIGLELRRGDGLLIHASSQKVEDDLPMDADGEGVVDVEIEHLPLLAGTYEITPSLNLAGVAATVASDAQRCGFSVWGELDQAGIVTLRYAFRAEEGSAAASIAAPSDAERLVYVAARGPKPS